MSLDLIAALQKTIKEKNNQSVIEEIESQISQRIIDAIQETSFYSLPFSTFQSILRKVDFSDNCISTELIIHLFREVNRSYNEEAIMILNTIKCNFAELCLSNCIDMLSCFTHCDLCIKLQKLYIQEEKQVDLDWEYELAQKQRIISELQEQIQYYQKHALIKPDDFEPDIFQAILNNKLSSVKYLFETGIVTKENKRLDDYLGNACRFGYLEIVKYLCEEQCINPEIENDASERPIHIACFSHHLQIVKYLCEVQKVDMNVPDFAGFTPLHCACYVRDLELIKYLCSQNVNTALVSNDGQTPFKLADDSKIQEFFNSIGVTE